MGKSSGSPAPSGMKASEKAKASAKRRRLRATGYHDTILNRMSRGTAGPKTKMGE